MESHSHDGGGREGGFGYRMLHIPTIPTVPYDITKLISPRNLPPLRSLDRKLDEDIFFFKADSMPTAPGEKSQ